MKILIVLLLALGVFILGCTAPGGGQNISGSANYQRCVSQCASGPGAGDECRDGCKVQEAQDSKNLYFCDQLYHKENRPSCYGIVAIASNDQKVCDQLTNSSDRTYCISIFGNPSTK